MTALQARDLSEVGIDQPWFTRATNYLVTETDVNRLNAERLLRELRDQLATEDPHPTEAARDLLLECIKGIASTLGQQRSISLEAQATATGGAVLLADNDTKRRRLAIEVDSFGEHCTVKRITVAEVRQRILTDVRDCITEIGWLGAT